MLVGLFPQDENAVDWLRRNVEALGRAFVEIHRQNHPPVTVGGEPPDPSFYALFPCADTKRHARRTAEDVLRALEKLKVDPSTFKVMIRLE